MIIQDDERLGQEAGGFENFILKNLTVYKFDLWEITCYNELTVVHPYSCPCEVDNLAGALSYGNKFIFLPKKKVNNKWFETM